VGDGGYGQFTSSVAKHFEAAHGLVNPFSQAAVGLKIPDDDSSRSVAVTLRDRGTLPTDSNGAAALAFAPSIYQERLQAASMASGVITFTGSYDSVTDYTAMSDAFNTYRLVAWGVRLIDIEPALNASGTIRLITVPARPNGGSTFSYESGLFEEVEDFALAQADLTWISKPIGVTWKEYFSVDSGNTDLPWNKLVVVIDGAVASTTVLRYEVVLHLECQVALGSVTGALATPAADHQPVQMVAADHARNKVKHAAKTPSMMRLLFDAAKGAVSSAIQSYGGPLLGGLVRRVVGNRMPPLLIEEVN
jgi:hypothetical protein